MVKRLRHRPFTAVTGVQIPLESSCERENEIFERHAESNVKREHADVAQFTTIEEWSESIVGRAADYKSAVEYTPMWLNWQSSWFVISRLSVRVRSSALWNTIPYGWIPEWPKGTDCKSAANCFGGSNPPPSIFFFGNIFEEENISYTT